LGRTCEAQSHVRQMKRNNSCRRAFKDTRPAEGSRESSVSGPRPIRRVAFRRGRRFGDAGCRVMGPDLTRPTQVPRRYEFTNRFPQGFPGSSILTSQRNKVSFFLGQIAAATEAGRLDRDLPVVIVPVDQRARRSEARRVGRACRLHPQYSTRSTDMRSFTHHANAWCRDDAAEKYLRSEVQHCTALMANSVSFIQPSPTAPSLAIFMSGL